MDNRSSVEELKLSHKCLLLIDEDGPEHSHLIVDHISHNLEIRYESYYTPNDINEVKNLITGYKHNNLKTPRIVHLADFDKQFSELADADKMWENQSLFMRNIFRDAKDLGLTLIISLKTITSFPSELLKHVDYVLINTYIPEDIQEIRRKVMIPREDFVTDVLESLQESPEMVYVINTNTLQENVVYYGSS